MLTTFAAAAVACSAAAFPCSTVQECTNQTFWHIPGPNPIVAPHGQTEWDSTECEVAGGVSKQGDTYYFIYHCLGNHQSYRVGISTATDPLGPWTLVPKKPNLDVTPGAWDKDTVASFNIMPHPHPKDPSEAWIGYYEGGMPPSKEDW